MGFGRYKRGIEFNTMDALLDTPQLANPWHFGVWDYGSKRSSNWNHRYEFEVYTKSFALTKPPSWRFHYLDNAVVALLWTVRVVLYHATPDDLPSDVGKWWWPHTTHLEEAHHADKYRYQAE